MRAFLGIPLNQAATREAVRLSSSIAEITGIKPVNPANYHITVKFLGDITKSQIEKIDCGLQRNLPVVGPLNLRLQGVGVFPSPRRPRVGWVGVEPRGPLSDIHAAVEDSAAYAGVERDKDEYLPHLTIFRCKDPGKARNRLVKWLNESSVDEVFFPADRLVLYQSKLRSDGPIYTKLEMWPL